MQNLTLIQQWTEPTSMHFPGPAGQTDSGVVSPLTPNATPIYAVLSSMLLWNDAGDYIEIIPLAGYSVQTPAFQMSARIKGTITAYNPVPAAYSRPESKKTRVTFGIPTALQTAIESMTHFSFNYKSGSGFYYTLSNETGSSTFQHYVQYTGSAVWLLGDGDAPLGDSGSAVMSPTGSTGYPDLLKIDITLGPTIFWTNRHNCVELP